MANSALPIPGSTTINDRLIGWPHRFRNGVDLSSRNEVRLYSTQQSSNA
jgi:hypothetical protein